MDDVLSMIDDIGGKNCSYHHTITMKNPYSKKPNLQGWIILERMLESFISNKYNQSETHLGDWTKIISTCTRWNAYMDGNAYTVYEYVSNHLEDNGKCRKYDICGQS